MPSSSSAAKNALQAYRRAARERDELIVVLKTVHDEAAHILGTEADDKAEVARINAAAICALARIAIAKAEGRAV